MSTATAAAPPSETRSAAILKGGTQGLEAVVDPEASTAAIVEALTARLEEAPAFFAGSTLRVRIEGPLPAGCLGELDALATRFDLRIAEIAPAPKRGPRVPAQLMAPLPEPAPLPMSSPVPDSSAGVAAATPIAEALPAFESGPVIEIIQPPSAPVVAAPAAHDPTRMVVGPVRSGVILDHDGHVVVIGDVNPGAEVRASGNIIVLGRLRGIAHAGIGGDLGFILASQLEPQQLRIGRVVARADSASASGSGSELAYVTDKSIVVERYTGKLPHGLAAGL